MADMLTASKRIRGAFLGMACGDAVGAAVEFCPPGSFEPLTDMIGGGKFDLEPGEWTDDTSMALCMAESLIDKGQLDLCDHLQQYKKWYETGHLSSTGMCFDIGMTTRSALNKFTDKVRNPVVGAQAARAAGNGSLMRLCPAPLAFWQQPSASMEVAVWSSRTTHGAPQCLDACRYFAGLLVGCMNGVSKDTLLSPMYSPLQDYTWSPSLHPEVKEVMMGSFRHKAPPDIVGSGYVVRTLEAALWAFFHTDNFRDGCLKVANIGDDADTTAAVYGQIAGAFYGEEGIPRSWREKCSLAPLICLFADEISMMADYYGPPMCLDNMIKTGNISDGENDLAPSSLISYRSSSAWLNIKKNGYDKLEESIAQFVRRMLPSPKAYKTLEEAENAKELILSDNGGIDREHCADLLHSVERLLARWIKKNTPRLARGSSQ